MRNNWLTNNIKCGIIKESEMSGTFNLSTNICSSEVSRCSDKLLDKQAGRYCYKEQGWKLKFAQCVGLKRQ